MTSPSNQQHRRGRRRPARNRSHPLLRNPNPRPRNNALSDQLLASRPSRTSGRRASFFVIACATPFAIFVLLWQHSVLMSHLEGGGDYIAYSSASSLEESVQQVLGVVKFVAYGGGLLAEDDDDDDDDDGDNNDDDGDNNDDDMNYGNDSNDSSWSYNERDEDSSLAREYDQDTSGSVIPYDLSVNNLRLILRAPGTPLPPSLVSEDFLPVVSPHGVTFRWRHLAKTDASAEDARIVTAYRIVVQRFIHCDSCNDDIDNIVWDSGKVIIKSSEDLPDSVLWKSSHLLKAGQIFQWRVTVWDAMNKPHSSPLSKMAIGPDANDWEGQWIVHPSDMDTFDSRSEKGSQEELDACSRWHLRHSLPLFRVKLSSQSFISIPGLKYDPIVSALLVVSGLGSFRVSMDGVPLSSSGPIDPPFTDYSKRVSYRGFDVTQFLVNESNEDGDKSKHEYGQIKSDQSHVIGISVGSGWWDHRPLDSGIVKFHLLPRGPATVVAQLFLTSAKGEVHVVIPSRGNDKGRRANVDGPKGNVFQDVWQVTRGHLRESDLFTGEIVDLGVMSTMEGWDTIQKWSEVQPKSNIADEIGAWVAPTFYRTDVTPQDRRTQLALQASALKQNMRSSGAKNKANYAAPIGQLVPSEIPPILPMERIAPDEIHDLGSGRWLFDFGKAFSGVLHFDEGLPIPIALSRDKYPRAHGFVEASANRDSFITVIYGESLEMTTGDINRVLVAGMGLHDGGPRHLSKRKGETESVVCFPPDHDDILSQRDVYMIPKTKTASIKDDRMERDVIRNIFSLAEQSHFTTHSFRFAEICCTAQPPKGVQALMYRTAFSEWGYFDSSNVLINGGYELVKNAMNSNMLSVQSDCPHREKLPYGGDLVADSPSALHMFDMSAFYRKTVRDWMDSQWDNGAYTETSVWQDLNDYAGIGSGAGETVWATAPPVITVRHMQHYGDLKFLAESLHSHIRWLEFLELNFYAGMKQIGFHENLENYRGEGTGLGDWLALRDRDTYLTHTAFYMAAARCVAYMSKKLGNRDMEQKSLRRAEVIRDRISSLYLKNGKDNFDYPKGNAYSTPGPEMSLFSRIVPGEKRCIILKNWFRRRGNYWPGDEEKLFLKELAASDIHDLFRSGELSRDNDQYQMSWSQWQGFNEGIFAIRYALKTLSDMGFHNIALRKATGIGFGTPEYMMRHNATTMWETWWRSEDLYSRNHPMLGATAEWMSSSVAGLSLYPTTTGGRKMLFWPRFPKSAAMIEFASAVQGSPVGDFAIAWRFENLPEDTSEYNSAVVNIRIRLLIPPSGEGALRLPIPIIESTRVSMSHSTIFPDFMAARKEANSKCLKRRKRRLGFPYSWEYDKDRRRWYRLNSRKAIGTPCHSFLFNILPHSAQWSGHVDLTQEVRQGKDTLMQAGFYDVVVTNWQLEPEVEGSGRIGDIPEFVKEDFDMGPYCKDKLTWNWDIDDATHII